MEESNVVSSLLAKPIKQSKNNNVAGKPGPGRPKGSPNKTTALLKEAILLAAIETGEDGEGKGGLVGYCKHLAATQPRAFSSLLGRVLPMQTSASDAVPITFVTVYEEKPK